MNADIAAILAGAGALAALVALLALHLLPTGLRPWRDPVSAYGISRYRSAYTVAALSSAAAGAGTALTLADVTGGTGAASILLWVFVAARAVIPFVPMDAPGTRSRRGRLHDLLAIAAFAAATAAAFVAAGALHDAERPGLAAIATAAACVMAVGSVGVLLAAVGARIRLLFGLAERLIYVGFLGWFLALSATVLAG